jgi:hypothetical protein
MYYLILAYFKISQKTLYDRLLKAKEMAYKQASGANYAYLLNTAKGKIEDGEDKYKSYLRNLFALLSNTKEQNAYEEESRALLGMGAYILFTMNSVVSQFTKHVSKIS